MKILLDENLPHELRLEIVGHEVFTVAFMGWSGMANGQLLAAAAAAGFDVLVTNDRGLEYQQDLENLPIAVIVILPVANTIEAIRPMLNSLQTALLNLQPCAVVQIQPPS